MNFTELQEKLKKKDIHLTNRKISEIWGMSEENVSRAKKGGWDIKHENIEKLEKALDISLIEKETITTQELKEKLNEIQKKLGMPTENITVLIPYRPDVYLSAGYGVEVYSESAEFMTLDIRLFTTDRGNKINPDSCEIVRISGNSMEPEYRHGDRVIIDRNDKELLDGHIFAFRYNGQCYVKEINLLGDKIKCISLNKEYDPFYIKYGEEFSVLGRILPRIRL